MKRITTISLYVLCVVLIISVAIGALCSFEHSCAAERCPVCMLADSFKTALAVLFCACAVYHIDGLICRSAAVWEQNSTREIPSTLISLKVKLSD